MKKRRLILKKESFGGYYADTLSRGRAFLRPAEYEAKNQELMDNADNSLTVQIIDVTKRGYPLLADATSSPNSIFWELTKRCNGTCTDCFMDANSAAWKNQEVSFSDIEKITRQFVDLGGHSVRLTGGEPTSRRDLFDIFDLLIDSGIEVGLNTNGMFGEKKLERILSRGIKDIRISLDGPEEVNDKIRWSGNYQGALKTIQRISEYNKTASEPTEPTINVVLMKSTLPTIEYMINLSSLYGFKLSFGLLRFSGRAKSNEILNPEEVVLASHRVQKMRDALGLKKGAIRVNYDIFCDGAQDGKGNSIIGFNPYPFDNSKCPLGSSLNLDAYGRIAPCGYFVNAPEWTGEDIRGMDLLEVWHKSPLLNKLRGLTRSGCHDCCYHKVKCNGGCPAMSYFVDGNIHGVDPYCIKDVNISKIINGAIETCAGQDSHQLRILK